MSDNDYDLDDEMSDDALEAEVQRRTAEMAPETARQTAPAGGGFEIVPQSVGIDRLTPPELDELILVRSGESEATSPAVKAAIAASEAMLPSDEEEAVGFDVGMSAESFAELLRRRPGAGGSL